MSGHLNHFGAEDDTTRIVSSLREHGGVILRNLVSEDLMDDIYAETQANVSAAAAEATGNTLWPKSNKTIGGLAGVSPMYTENLVVHPKVLEIADTMLLPRKPMSPYSDPAAFKKSGSLTEVVENDQGSTQVIAKWTDPQRGPNCDHYNVGSGSMLEVHRGGAH